MTVLEAVGRRIEAMPWWDRASCSGVDPDVFFPQRGVSTRPAKELCKCCEVRSQCLEYALQTGERFGIWGGLSERERRNVRKARALASAAYSSQRVSA